MIDENLFYNNRELRDQLEGECIVERDRLGDRVLEGRIALKIDLGAIRFVGVKGSGNCSNGDETLDLISTGNSFHI
jgi:hypothetical protein